MISNNQLKSDAREAFDFLRSCDDQHYKEFQKESRYIHIPRGSHILEQGDNCAHLALMLRGTVRVFKLADTGREITLYRIGAGQSCILTASCIQSENPFPAFAISDDDVEAILVPSHSLQKWLAESTAWQRYIFGLISHRLTSVISLVEEVAFRKLDQRVAKLLIQYQNESRSSPFNVTHYEIALELGTSREVVSRILMDFQSKGSTIELWRKII